MLLYIIKCDVGSLGNLGWAVSEISYIKEMTRFKAYRGANSQDVGVFEFNNERDFHTWKDKEKVKDFIKGLNERCISLSFELWGPSPYTHPQPEPR